MADMKAIVDTMREAAPIITGSGLFRMTVAKLGRRPAKSSTQAAFTEIQLATLCKTPAGSQESAGVLLRLYAVRFHRIRLVTALPLLTRGLLTQTNRPKLT